jgi:6,7-dimethyl-8-ribityllumazine synthase
VSTKDSPERAPGHLDGPQARLLVIQAPYYADVVGGMRAGAEAVLAEAGAMVEVADVAGAYELPAALRMAMKRQLWDGFLLLGCVVRGETDHYTFICDAVCQGVMAITAETGVPLGFGLLTVDNLDQALARSRPDRMNKGAEAAHALLGQLALARAWATKSTAQQGGRR